MTFMILHLTFLVIWRQFYTILQTFVKQGWSGKLLKKNHSFIRGSEDCNNESYFRERKHFSCKLTIQLLVKLCTLPLQHFILLAAIAALYVTMSVGRSVSWSVGDQRVSKFVILLQDNRTMHRIHTMHRIQCIEYNA